MKDEKTISNICVYGIGGVGGYFGGKIAYSLARLAGETRKVFFVARGQHLEKIKREGLLLNTSEQQSMVCKPFLATDNLEEVPVPDLCLLCVKSYDLQAAAFALAKRVGSDTVIIPLLNGVDIYERIREILHKGTVLPACAYVATHIEGPGVVTQKGTEGIILCGKDPKNPSLDPAPIISFFNDMSIRFTWLDDPFPAIWEKYIFIAAFGLVTAYSGKTLGEVMSDESLKGLVERIMVEIVSIAERKCIQLHEEIVSMSLDKANRFTFETKTSFQRDMESPGRQNEGDLFGETIVRMGKLTGVPTVVTQAICLKMQHKDI